MQNKHEIDAIVKISNSVNALMCMVSPEGFFVHLNLYWQELLGWTLAELKSRPVIDFVHPDDLADTLYVSNRVLAGQQDIGLFRNRYRKKDNNHVWLEWKAILSDDGQLIASGQNVSERVLIEQQNEANVMLLEQAGSIGQIGHWSIDFTSKKIFWSQQVYVIHGVTPDEYTPELESAIGFYHPDDIDEVQGLVDSALMGHADWQFNLRIVRPSGEIRNVVSKADISRDLYGQPSHVFGIIQDVTERENLNDQLKLLSQVAETSITGVVITDVLSRVIWVNNAFVEMSGYGFNEVKGSPLGKFLQGDETSQTTINIIKHKMAKQLNVDVDILNYRKDGSTYWINLLISPVVKNGRLTNFIGFQQDITERKEQKKLVAEAQRRDAISQLASGICHDFNNIMGIIMGNVELIELQHVKSLQAYVGNIKNASERAQALTQRLLKMSKHNKSEEDDAVVINVDAELLDICAMLHETIPKNITLKHNLQAGESALVNKGDFNDSIINLVINAMHAISHHGEITVSSQISHSFESLGRHVVTLPKAAKEYIKLTISDDGCGIPADSFQKIFTPFYTTRKNENGTGLGLSLLVSFVVRENLGLSLKSQLDEGTEISIWLPVKHAAKAINGHSEIASKLSLPGVRIVLIDDEVMLLELNNSLLTHAGALVKAFSEPQEALHYIEQHSADIDLVVTDHFMPGDIQGSDIVNFMQDKHCHIPCIVLSGDIMHSNLQGIDVKILSKPIKFEVFKQEIINVLKAKAVL